MSKVKVIADSFRIHVNHTFKPIRLGLLKEEIYTCTCIYAHSIRVAGHKTFDSMHVDKCTYNVQSIHTMIKTKHFLWQASCVQEDRKWKRYRTTRSWA